MSNKALIAIVLITISVKRNIPEKLSFGIDRDTAMHPNGDTIMLKLLSAALLAIGLATSAMAQTAGQETGGTGNDANTGVNTGTSGANTGTGTGTTPNTIDPNATNATPQGNGMNDRCKDTAGNDTDNNTPSGAMTSDMQNCNK
ncbi:MULTISPECIES: hypothetical protein [unclassified Mesorhizobium]|uniref:hypothetical protein n=2 Tax=Mesorhizobium TaxID=68287 RepID=UPI0033392F76